MNDSKIIQLLNVLSSDDADKETKEKISKNIIEEMKERKE